MSTHEACLWIAALGVVEAVVWLMRMRSAVGTCPTRSAIDAAMTVGLRLLAIWIGSGTIIAGGEPAAVLLAYCGSVAAATYAAHRWVVGERA